jgi:hypothetical protein
MGRSVLDDTETMSEVSMPVRYAPFDVEGMGPRIMGWKAEGVDVGGR